MTSKPKPNACPLQPELQQLLNKEPDLVDRIMEFIKSDAGLRQGLERLAGQDDPIGRLDRLEAAVRSEFAGEVARVRRRSASLHLQVLALFNGRNASEVARVLNLSRATVYRVIKQPGVAHRIRPAPPPEAPNLSHSA